MNKFLNMTILTIFADTYNERLCKYDPAIDTRTENNTVVPRCIYINDPQ